MFFVILGTFLWIAIAFWPALIAKRKGYNFFLFLILSWLISFVIMLIIALLLRDKNETPEEREADAAAEAELEREENRA